jgi:Tfp pilus assembly protein PilN
MRAVNLLPKEFAAHKSLREEDPAVVVGSALAVVVIIALGASFLVAHSKAGAQQKRLTAVRLELAQLSLRNHPTTPVRKPAVPITPIVPPPAIVGQEATWLTAVSSTLSQRIAWDRLLRDVSLVMPDDVTLSSMTMTAPASAAAIPGAPPAAAPAQGFVIAGSAFSYASVARLLSRLSLVPELSNVTLTSTGSGAKSGVEFSITAAVKGAPVPPAPAITTPAVTDTTDTTSGVGA